MILHGKMHFALKHIELGCCGADKPSDWHEIPWINMDFLNEKSEVVMRLAGADGKVLPPVSPYSCCTPRVLAACYHDPLQQSEWRSVWSGGSPLPSASLHTRGCVEAVRAPLTKAMLALQLLSVLVFFFQVLIVLLSQLLRTSARDAVLTGDCDGEGNACLIGHVLHTKKHEPDKDTEVLHEQRRLTCIVSERRHRRRYRRQARPKDRYLYPS